MKKYTGFIGKYLFYLILLLWTVISIFPLYWMILFSFKDNNEIFNKSALSLPESWNLTNYVEALTKGQMGRYFFNSILVTGITIFLTLVIALMASYAVSRLLWKGRTLLNNIFMLGLTLPIHAALLPVFLILRSMHMLNTFSSLFIPYTAFALAMAIMICNSFMMNIPEELEESACMDGCGTFGIFFRIIVPLMKPAVSTIAIFTFLQAWNELMFATVFVSDSAHRTLTVGMQSLVGTYSTNWGPIGAALVIATIPTVIVYLFMSKKVQDSLVAGAIKG
ncbi:ABC transporter, permease protein [Marvinbryantia formatexigens DSM 14469]|uniref:ABC transporter, permease protein n=1 Tax=Marvinbryantia formatexigens DSM 14469 TaxID=478749 RepID=C6LHI5_9FIRM|nr:carbohydrate ABC transporter permease [Marvinbryantia formatexigens]EET59972.1 ABC transporter, permease protein [Marvinbryantia formatexigens DSM 14469]UWO25871.1 carbohydrate ABC transporter permease [Marvinbryantia formatexigens DSM 14469]SDF40917.1 raffinose/stachyose/melibiose transport system permease protein [Marvinbryantia formatexigens]